jgi:hypothetical protein
LCAQGFLLGGFLCSPGAKGVVMAVIGIITCEILELEFTKLLSEDPDIRRITILEDEPSARLIELLKAKKLLSLRLTPHPHAFSPEPDMPLEVLIRVLPLGLHRTRKLLVSAITQTIRSMRSRVDVLLLGYGRCGGSLDDLQTLADTNLPIFQPMDQESPVHDCVALSLGGGERYYNEQRHTAGTYYLTPGWSQHWRSMLDSPSGMSCQPGIGRLLSGYERALLVQTPAISPDELHSQGVEFAEKTGLRLETQDGTMAPLVIAWKSAKSVVLSKPKLSAARRSA